MKIQFNRHLAHIILWSLASVLVIISLGFSSHEQGMMPCRGLRINVADETGNYFIEPSDIRELLNSRGKKIKGSPMGDINMGVLEKIVYSNPYVSKAEVYSSIDGYVTIDIWQRDPVMRIINNDNEHFYVDDQGVFMPVSDQYTKPVIVASGYIFDGYRQKNLQFASANPSDTALKPVLTQLNEVAMFLRSNPFWDAQIEQIYVNAGSEIELIPRVGDHNILLGNTNDLETKMQNLYVFYTEAMKKAGWSEYSQINLKYRNQVVCTRRNALN